MMTPDIHITINMSVESLVIICATVAFVAMVWATVKAYKRGT